ncbi:MAG: hypothetical protein FH749_06445 [Firmicutes bacterium]|nr:hypothetical protein [Bacillota bacterium]
MKAFFRKIKKKYRSLPKAKRVLTVTVIVLLLTGSVAGAASSWYWSRLGDTKGRLQVEWPEGDNDEILDIWEAFDENIINIALFGFDRTEARDEIYIAYRPDTIMVASINLETGEVDLVSIPRDTLVPIYNRGGGKDKINHSYYYGWDKAITGITDPDEQHKSGLNSVRQTVSMALNVPIHYWVSLDMDGVVEIVNIMGGVWYDVEHDVYTGHGNRVIEKGYQKLNGRQFLWYARTRDFYDGDLRRVQNQQNLLKATFEQFARANKLVKAPEVYLSMRNNVETNLTVEQMASLALFATRNIKPENIESHILPGRMAYGRPNERYTRANTYYIIDQQARAQMIYDIWGISVTPGATDVLLPPLPDDDGEEEEDDATLPEVPPGNGNGNGNGNGTGGDDNGDNGKDEDNECEFCGDPECTGDCQDQEDCDCGEPGCEGDCEDEEQCKKCGNNLEECTCDSDNEDENGEEDDNEADN